VGLPAARAFLQLMWVIRRPGLVLAIETPGQVLAYEKSKNALAATGLLGFLRTRLTGGRFNSSGSVEVVNER
jgi:hypothetical protein